MNFLMEIPECSEAKEKILLTAHKLFYLHGVRATGIDKIIEEAQVTKTTFYRHYPSKNHLIMAYLEYRHNNWIQWFHYSLKNNLNENSDKKLALITTIKEWLEHPHFRGCAFINATVEIGEILEDVQQMSQAHKAAVKQEISIQWGVFDKDLINSVVMAIDGAITNAQIGIPVKEIVGSLHCLLGSLNITVSD